MRTWTAAALAGQKQIAARLSREGVQIVPDFVYTRTLNGFAAVLDSRALALLERDRDVVGIYPVRVAYPAADSTKLLGSDEFGLSAGRRAVPRVPGFDGTGVTIALLDTGIDPTHPYLRGRLLEGIDILDAEGRAFARPHPHDSALVERHATQTAGLLVGSGGPAGLHGAAPGATLLPIRVAGWQPSAEGGFTVYGRTDQLLAGLERAVDPDGDGSTLDGVRVALVGLAEPFAAFADGPARTSGSRRGSARHARRCTGRQRRSRRARLRQHRRAGRRPRRTHRRRRGRPPAHAGRASGGAGRPARAVRRGAAAGRRRGAGTRTDAGARPPWSGAEIGPANGTSGPLLRRRRLQPRRRPSRVARALHGSCRGRPPRRARGRRGRGGRRDRPRGRARAGRAHRRARRRAPGSGCRRGEAHDRARGAGDRVARRARASPTTRIAGASRSSRRTASPSAAA